MSERTETAINPCRPRRMEIEFEATDKTANRLFELVANLVHGRTDLGAPWVFMQIVRHESGRTIRPITPEQEADDDKWCTGGSGRNRDAG